MALDKIAPLLGDIHLLVVLSQTRSFTRAARRLNVSKASVSMRISELERVTGIPLVHRTTRSVGLTEAGHRLVTESLPAFERIDASFTAVKDLSDTPGGIIRVTAPVAFGRQHLAPQLAPFLRRFPEVRVQLELTDRLVNLTHEGFDVAIRHTSAAPENYVAWPLCETRSVLVASPDYLRQRGTPTHPAELVDHDCLLYLGNAGADTWTFVRDDASAQAEPVSVQVKGPLMANNSEMLREVVLSGLGIGLLPDFSTVPQAGKSLIRVLTEWRVQGFFGSRIYALRPWAAQVPRAVQCFIEHMRDAFRTEDRFEHPADS